jgi:hypothetical protein
MKWIKIHSDRASHPKIQRGGFWVYVVSGALWEISGEFDCAGKLASQYCDPEYIAKRLQVPAEIGGVEAIRQGLDAAEKVGLIKRTNGTIVIRNWKKRQKDPTGAKRKAKERERKRLNGTEPQEKPARHVAGQSRDSSVTVRPRGEERRGDKKREEKKEGEKPQTLSVEDILNTFPSQMHIPLGNLLGEIARARKTGRVADSVKVSLLEKLKKHPGNVVLRAIETYIGRDYAGEKKDERYFLGIVRGEADKPAQDESRAAQGWQAPSGRVSIGKRRREDED